MSTQRAIKQFIKATPRREGPAIVHRALPSEALPFLDPFLAIGEFRMPAMQEGFGFHTHKGVEFITYQLDGQLQHSDPQGTSILLEAGEAMHLIAGACMTHSETPIGTQESHGIQLWIDLAEANKRESHTYKKAGNVVIPVQRSNGITIRKIVIPEGPLNLHTPSIYFDVQMEARVKFNYPISEDWNAFILVLGGVGLIGKNKEAAVQNDLATLDKGTEIEVTAKGPLRFLLLAGQPLNEGGKGMFS